MGSLRKVSIVTSALASLVLTILPITAFAESSSALLIVRLQTGSKTSAGEEFIELANVSSSDVDLTNWRLEYFSATAKSFDSPTRTIPLSGSLMAGKRLTVASNDYLKDVATIFFSSTLASAGGHVRLATIDASKHITQQDLVGWGTATMPLGSAAPAPPAGISLDRKTDSAGTYARTGNNAQDFAIAATGGMGGDMAPVQLGGFAAQLDITELLPNPASPQTDSQDEFVELYNPTSETVQLAGYKLQTGSTFSHSYTFKDQTIAPGSYKAFFITETKATLANSGGRARLLAPDGSTVSETESYGAAGDGDAWAWDGAVWQWTTTPTPGQQNVLTEKADKAAATTNKKVTTTKKASTAKAKTSSAKATKATKTGSGATDSSGGQSGSAGSPDSALHPAVLAGVGGLAVLYGAYEYRHDMANLYHRVRKFRGHRKTGRTAGAKA